MHEKFLLAALAEAQSGQGFCAPNPSVGAVAVKDNEIIARAWHRGAGTPHAERLLIDQLPAKEAGVTLYVTLEPCNHHGRTPPCVDAIINYGFEQVIYAYSDPNPIVAANNTHDRLKASGIRVEQCSLPEIDAFYQAYQYWTRSGKPWVTAKIAQTFDGKIAGPQGERVQLSNADCERFTHENRLKNDVILTTAETVHRDNPQLNVRIAGKTLPKPVAIIDRKLSLNPTSRIFNTASHCHIFYDKQLIAPVPVEHRTYHPVSSGNGALCLPEVAQQLGRLGFHGVWLEAGGTLFNAIHEAHLVNRTHVYLVPRILGDEAVSAYKDVNILNQPQTISWTPMGDNMIATLDWEQPCSQV